MDFIGQGGSPGGVSLSVITAPLFSVADDGGEAADAKGGDDESPVE